MSDSDYGALLLRLGLGVMYVAHAGLKVFTFTLAGTAAFFESAGYPGWMVYPVVAGEAVGGMLLLLGVQARWVALGLVPVLLGALAVHLGNGWVFTAPNGGWEYPAFLILASLVQALIGDGAHALVPSWWPMTGRVVRV
ncbi:DoxX family protein [Azospirillum sp. TSO22-1]|uniref:DoxX family protein n=1 Tax=Azospirillum sp. TSO22-1 TaxID=716789 RepID=UPI000D61BFE1|nr:DoxX family protein [Azospirillum sp. TSO22-1]PWC44790.1 hypothetical protein TSO221_17265 [Azospirillum sp. TSO22-1]